MRKKREKKKVIDLICLCDKETDLLYGLKTTDIEMAKVEAVVRAEREKIPRDRLVLSVWCSGDVEDSLVEV